jgi:hypothetical protein
MDSRYPKINLPALEQLGKQLYSRHKPRIESLPFITINEERIPLLDDFEISN